MSRKDVSEEKKKLISFIEHNHVVIANLVHTVTNFGYAKAMDEKGRIKIIIKKSGLNYKNKQWLIDEIEKPDKLLSKKIMDSELSIMKKLYPDHFKKKKGKKDEIN